MIKEGPIPIVQKIKGCCCYILIPPISLLYRTCLICFQHEKLLYKTYTSSAFSLTGLVPKRLVPIKQDNELQSMLGLGRLLKHGE